MDNSDSLLITGSSGFVGLSFLDHLATLEDSQRPGRIGLISRGDGLRVPQALESTSEIVHIKADLRHPWNFDFSPTKILHLAADGSSDAYSADAAHGFVEIAQNFRSWVKNYENPTVFHASSGACFGHVPLRERGKFNESTTWPKSMFIEYRLKGEDIMQDLQKMEIIQLRIGRLFSFIGKHIREKEQYAIPSFVSSALKNHLITVNGNPATTRSYLAAEDMSDWIYRAFAPNVTSDVLAIGSEIPVTIKEVAEFVASRTRSDVVYNQPESHGDFYVAANKETRDRLHVSETRTWQSSLESYIVFCERAMTNDR